ncbi:MAG: hypothetical protein ACFE9D_00480 [Promethearchaeota archaeon]
MLNRRVSIAILVVVVISGWLTFPNRVTGETIESVIICVYCEGDWSGSYGARSDIHQISGNTSTTYQFNRTNPTYGWAPTAIVSKTSPGTYNLTLTIETPTRIKLERATTTAEYGQVTVAWSEEPIPIPGFPWPAILFALIGTFPLILKQKRNNSSITGPKTNYCLNCRAPITNPFSGFLYLDTLESCFSLQD